MGNRLFRQGCSRPGMINRKGFSHMVLRAIPPVRFLRAAPGGPVPFEPQLLDSRIPTKNPLQSTAFMTGYTYRTYMHCIHQFIINNSGLLDAIYAEAGLPGSIQSFDIISEKHGSDYHPARVAVHGPDACLSLVVNVAVNERGKQRLEEDFRLLGRLRSTYETAFVPRPYVMGKEPVPGHEGGEMLMFMAEWFEGFHEFHLSASVGTEDPQLVLWDLDRGYVTLSEREAREVFRQVAFILTTFYDTMTFEEVFPWHHASGDFVVSRKNGNVDVRLITVRQYAARPVFAEPSASDRMLALLLFFANLTVRMRLDRLDGVGEVAWAGEQSVAGTIQGFTDALANKVSAGHCEPELFAEFLETIRSLPLPEMTGIFHAVLGSYDDEAADTPVVRRHLVDHIFQVYRSVQDLPIRSQ